MKQKLYGFALAVTFVLAPVVQAAVVNVNGTSNASLDGANAVDVLLGAGTYQLSFVQGNYTAFTRFSAPVDCDSGGKNCRQGWENSVRYIIGTDTFLFGDGAATGGYGPLNPGDGYYIDAATSFANAAGYIGGFTLNAAQNVKFFLYDDILGDNQGGVSLLVAAVPLPAAAWLFGSALIGLVAVSRRKAAA